MSESISLPPSSASVPSASISPTSSQLPIEPPSHLKDLGTISTLPPPKKTITDTLFGPRTAELIGDVSEKELQDLLEENTFKSTQALAALAQSAPILFTTT